MTQTAHHIDQTFYVKQDWVLSVASWSPVLQIDPSGATLQTESGLNITLDGQLTDTIFLSSYKIKRNTFVATGGPNT